MSVLKVTNLSVSLKNKNSIRSLADNISFSIKPGECLGILGESGSGKSITVKAFTGLLDKNFIISGQALFNGSDLLKKSRENLRSLRGKEITMVLQNPMICFDPLYRIGEQISETFRTHTDWTQNQIQEKSEEILSRMQLQNPAELLEKYPHELSGGMLQRIMIGLAISLEPKLLIADEPTTAIDAITQYEILEEFRKIKLSKKTAILFITHDLGAISRIADKILVINNGKIVDKGTFSDILHHSVDPYTKLLIEKRSAVMNQYHNLLHKGRLNA